VSGLPGTFQICIAPCFLLCFSYVVLLWYPQLQILGSISHRLEKEACHCYLREPSPTIPSPLRPSSIFRGTSFIFCHLACVLEEQFHHPFPPTYGPQARKERKRQDPDAYAAWGDVVWYQYIYQWHGMSFALTVYYRFSNCRGTIRGQEKIAGRGIDYRCRLS